MTPQETKTLLAIDRDIDTNPTLLTPKRIDLWRRLFVKSVEEAANLANSSANGREVPPRIASVRMA